MKISNDFNQHQNFKAKLEIHKNLRHSKKLQEISKLFEEKTKKSTNDVLAIDFHDFLDEYFYILNNNEALFLAHPIQDILKKDSNSQIVKKLVKVFKCLKCEEENNNNNQLIDKELEGVKNIYTKFKDKANALDKAGRFKFALLNKKLAERNKARFERLVEQRKQFNDKMVSDIKKIAGDDKDFNGYISAITGMLLFENRKTSI